MKTLKLLMKLSCFMLLLSAGFCEEDEEVEYTCEDCIAAQDHLCNALLNANCSSSNVSNAIERVKDQCPNGTAKANTIISQCGLGDNLNCLGFSCQ